MDLPLLIAFGASFFLVALSPGLCMTLAMSLGISIGVRRTLWMMAGELTGIACPSVASCVGIGGYATAAGDVVTMAGRASLPTVTKLSSDRGSTTGGTPMYVIGANLADVVSVHFGAARARIDGLVVPAELEVTPPRGTGTVFVTVASAWGSSRRTARARYTYVRPRR